MTWLKEHWDSIIASVTAPIAIGLLLFVWLRLPPDRVNEKVSITTAIATSVVAIATGVYAWHTRMLSKATVKMAEEMREQRIMTSRPVIIQKTVAVSETEFGLFGANWFSHFEVYNAGNGPAIEVETSLLNKEKSQIGAHRGTFLRAGESSIRGNHFLSAISFDPFNLVNLDESNYYIVCEYQGIFSRTSKKQTWYQTWLPFKLSKATKEGEVYVVAGELEFKDEVGEKERIDAFGSGSKPI